MFAVVFTSPMYHQSTDAYIGDKTTIVHELNSLDNTVKVVNALNDEYIGNDWEPDTGCYCVMYQRLESTTVFSEDGNPLQVTGKVWYYLDRYERVDSHYYVFDADPWVKANLPEPPF